MSSRYQGRKKERADGRREVGRKKAERDRESDGLSEEERSA